MTRIFTLVALAVFVILAHLMGLQLLLGVILAVVVAMIIGVGSLIARELWWRRGGRLSFHDPDQMLFSVPCTKCSGGTQGLVKGVWGPIPDNMKMEQRTGGNRGWFSSPMANHRTCTCCNGLGSHWTAKDEIKLPPPHS